jgi:plastocyanin/predicted small secreted protein
MKKFAVALSLLACAAVLAGCSDNTKVGEGIKVGEGTVGTRIGETTTTTAPAVTTTTTIKGATTTQKTATTKPQQVSLEIIIQLNDPYYVPKVGSVNKGSLVRWTNKDSVGRSVVAANGAFDSHGPIPPGGHMDYTATQSGQFEYCDPDRPYACGTLQVSG